VVPIVGKLTSAENDIEVSYCAKLHMHDFFTSESFIVAFYLVLTHMTINKGNQIVFVLLYIMMSFALIILLVASPMVVRLSFADNIYPMRPGATLALGCDIVNDKDFTTSTKVFKYDQPDKLTFNCERPGGDVNLEKGQSITIRCLHDNALANATDITMKPGDLSYVICQKN
jgi:hypothetical protein